MFPHAQPHAGFNPQQQQQQQHMQQQHIQQQQQQQQPRQPLFACVIPGRPMCTDFAQVTPNNVVMEVPAPASVREFSLSLLQPVIPQDHGVAVYFSLPPFNEWSYVGSVDLQSPSAIFRAPWAGRVPAELPSIRIGLAVEPLDRIRELVSADAKEDERTLDSAKGIAKDLFTFMQSFSRTGAYQNMGDVLVIPTNCIDRWMEKFFNKHRRDPYFWLKRG